MATFWYPWVSKQPIRAGRIPRSAFNAAGTTREIVERISWPELPTDTSTSFGSFYRNQLRAVALVALLAGLIYFVVAIFSYSFLDFCLSFGTWLATAIVLGVGISIASLYRRFRRIHDHFALDEGGQLSERQSFIY